ncbi:MAG: hypothetical protein JRM77_06875 [Nitrososphaerota archaeon]|nr:hypothetical protein [Nitrososphaerota archaeon]
MKLAAGLAFLGLDAMAFGVVASVILSDEFLRLAFILGVGSYLIGFILAADERARRIHHDQY